MKVNEEKILEVAYSLIKQKGVKSVSLQHIANACGISLLDVKFRFKSKKELVLAFMGYIISKKSTYLSINSSLSPSAVSELNNFFKFIDENINEWGDGILVELRRYDPLTLDRLKEWVDMRLMPYLQRIIERGLSEGFYRVDLNYELYVTTYFYVIRSVLESDSHDWENTRQMISHINDIFYHGALNSKGMRI